MPPRRPLTVLQILPALDSGGVERGTVELAEELVRRGHRSLVISAGGRLVERLHAAGATHITWPVGRKSPATARWISPLRSLLLRENVDVLHARSRVPAWVAWLAWRSLPHARRPAFVTTAHGLYSVNSWSAVMTRGERVIAISKTVEEYLRRNYPKLDPARIRLVYRGVDPAEFPHGYTPDEMWLAGWHRAFPQLQNRRLVTLPGRLTRLKGHEVFLDLIARLRRQVPDVHGLIVGGEDPRRQEYARRLRRRVIELGLAGDVTFTGHRSDIRDVLAVSDVVVSLSADPPEAFGRTALEALSLGRPVVGFAQAGIGEILEALYPAGAVLPGALETFERRLCSTLHTPLPVPCNNVFTRQAMLDGTLAVYEELLGQRRAEGLSRVA